MRRTAVLASLVLACGDNVVPVGPDLTETSELVIVAHPGDELLLMQPDIRDAVERGSITIVYLRADVAGARDGLRSAYGHVADDTDWRCGDVTIEGAPAHHCRLADSQVSLVFLPTPDLAALTRIVRLSDAEAIRTLEVTGTHGDDDPDHAEAGQLTMLSLGTSSLSAQLFAYRGDPIVEEPPNKLTPIFDASFEMLARYAACTSSCGAECGGACTAVDQHDADLLLRRYALGFRRSAGGRLRLNNECLTTDLSLASCDTAPVWTLDGAGELRTGDTCITVDGPALSLQRCLGGVERRWFVDDDGHIMSAAGELRCLTPRTGTLQLEACGPSNDPRWEIVPLAETTARAALGITATGREVRLADVTGDSWADLCAVEAGELHCARGTGTGEFLPAFRLDSAEAPLAIDARSLTFGDVDADGILDACGRNEQGVLCATAASDFHAMPWTPAFDAARAIAATGASLTVLDANADGIGDICGMDIQGVLCAIHSSVFDATLLSAWPDDDAVVWLGDLDGDQSADWCTATETGPACGIAAQRMITMDGVPWGYSHDGVVEVTPATTATVALGDIDRDGRADLCSLRDDRIVCARSQGRAFGPRVTLAILPNQTTASALWLGDLDGDGRMDPCVDTGTDIVCARQPQ